MLHTNECHCDLQVNFPRSITFLTGAPGAGKGSNLAYIKDLLGADHTIGLSTELSKHHQAMQHLIEGTLVPESLVTRTFFKCILTQSAGAPRDLVIDGFPRSRYQVCYDFHVSGDVSACASFVAKCLTRSTC